MKIGNRVGNDYERTPEEKMAHNAAMPPSATYMARCIGIYNIGTHEEEWKGKKKWNPKVMFDFELYGPGTLHVFDEKKGPQPWTVQKEMTFTNLSNGTLYKVLKAWYNSDPQKIAEVESGELVLEPLLGKLAMLGVTKKPKATKPDEMKLVMDTITTPMAGTEQNAPAQSINPLRLFDLDNFNLQNPQFVESFFSIPGFVRNKCLESKELKDKGVTKELLKKMFPQYYAEQQASAPSAPSAAGASQKIMSGPYSYEQLKVAGWSDQQMIDAGYLKIQAPVAAPAPAPAPMAPPAAAPAQPLHKMTAKAGGMTYEQFRTAGWSDVQLVSNGYMEGPSATPVAPAMPAAPMAPPVAPPVAPPAGAPFVQDAATFGVPWGTPASGGDPAF